MTAAVCMRACKAAQASPACLLRSRAPPSCLLCASQPYTHAAPFMPPLRRRLRIDTGWMPGLPVGSYFRFTNVTFSCTGNLTHPLPPGARMVCMPRRK